MSPSPKTHAQARENDTQYRIQGLPVSEVAQRFGTPVFIYDTETLQAGYRSLRERLHPSVDVFFSLKSNPNISICSFFGSLGAGAEVSSLTELTTALRAGVAPHDIIFLGPGKSAEEITACVDHGIHAIVCESLEELQSLDDIVTGRGLQDVRAVLRLNPGFHTKGSGLAMGGKPRQFGIDTDLVRASRDLLSGLRSVRVEGFHVYMGTRFLKHADIVHNTAEILALAESLADELGIPLRTVDFGGGLGVAYFDGESDLDEELLAAGINDVVARFAARHPEARLIMELGRYLTAKAGLYVVRTRYVKESMGEWFAVTDGGTNHHVAATGVGSFVRRNFPIRSLTRHGQPPSRAYTVTGPLCTPNDVLGKRVELPETSAGDLIGVERSGAYGPTASPGYFLSHGFPAEVLIHEGRPYLIRERDTVADMLRKQRLVKFPADQMASER